MKLQLFILICLFFVVSESQNIEITTDNYIDVILAYFRERNVRLLTHLTCFSASNNAKIAYALSKENIQSRFIGVLGKTPILTDTPIQTIQGFVVNRLCDLNINIFMREDHGILFKDNHKWLFIDVNSSLTANESMAQYSIDLNVFNALPRSDVFIAKRIQIEPIQWQLFDAYKVYNGYGIEITPNGMITTLNDQLKVVETNFAAIRRQNLKGIPLNCGITLAFPERFTYIEDPAYDNIDVFYKSTYRLGYNVADDSNFSCQIMQTDNFGWPKEGKVENVGGLIGLFQKKKVQFSLQAINMRTERSPYVEYTGDVHTFRTPIIFRQPPLSSIKNIFTLPFELSLWICVVILMFVIFTVMLFQMRNPRIERSLISTIDVATLIWGAVCQQGTHLNIPTISGRIVVVTAFISTLALFTSYSASIVALLQSPSNYIKTIDDLIASPLKVGFHEHQYVRFSISANYSSVTDVYTKKVLPQGDKGWIRNAFAGIEKVRTELFAFQVDSPSAYKAIGRTFSGAEKCSLSEIQMIVLPKASFCVERNSGIKELVSQRIKWQHETGLMKREELRWFPKVPNCEGSRGFLVVGLSEIKPAVYLLLIGYGLSALIFISEYTFKKLFDRYKHLLNKLIMRKKK